MGKWPFCKKNHRLIPWKKPQFFHFLNFFYLQLRKALYCYRILKKKPFPRLYQFKKKKKRLEKKKFFNKNHQLTPLQKSQFFDFFTFWFLQPTKAFFRSRVSPNTFSWPIILKKEVDKMAIFGPKPWVNPFGKISNFGLFELFLFIAQNGVFSIQNIIKHIFLAYID